MSTMTFLEGNSFYKLLARAFTISLKLGFIPYVWMVAVLCMLIKPDKLPLQTTSYRPISLLSAIMKLFERVIEKRLGKQLKDNGFFSKYQSGFTKSKSTNNHLFRLSQTIMESFNRDEHVIGPSQMLTKHSTMFGTMDSCTKFTNLVCPPSFVGGSPIFLLEESCKSKLRVSCLQKSRCPTRFQPESITFPYLCQ